MVGEHGTISEYQRKCRCDECRAANRVYKREYAQRHRERDLVQVRLAKARYERSEKGRLTKRAWRKTEKGKASSRRDCQTRKARKLDQFVEVVDPLIVYQMHGGMCGICKELVSVDDFHVDHVIPLSRGGLHGYTNVQPAHPKCNLKKHAKEMA